MEVGLQCLSGRCGKWSAEDPYERWNFYVQHAAPEQLAAPNGVQLFCRGAMQALVKDKWLGKDKWRRRPVMRGRKGQMKKAPFHFSLLPIQDEDVFWLLILSPPRQNLILLELNHPLWVHLQIRLCIHGHYLGVEQFFFFIMDTVEENMISKKFTSTGNSGSCTEVQNRPFKTQQVAALWQVKKGRLGSGVSCLSRCSSRNISISGQLLLKH